MAKPRVFISSTFYDLKQIRTDLDNFIRGLGYDVIRNEKGDIPYGTQEALEEYCYNEISSIDILVAIIGGRFGSATNHNTNYSISNEEIRTALNNNKQVYIFIEKDVDTEFYTYLKNKDKDIVYFHVDDVRIYRFIEEIHALKKNNIIHTFTASDDIITYLKEQWAGLFQRFLHNQANIVEVNKIKQLNESLKTVENLTTFLANREKDQRVTINEILILRHPILTAIKQSLNWMFPIIFHTFEELKLLLAPWGYIYDADNIRPGYFTFINKKYKYILYITREVFAENGDLIPNSNLTNENEMVIKEKLNEIDDLPF